MDLADINSDTTVVAAYACWANEPILEVVSSFAKDVLQRGSLYPRVTSHLARSLTKFSSSSLDASGWPGYERRHKLYHAVLTTDFFRGVNTLFATVRQSGDERRPARLQRGHAQIKVFKTQLLNQSDAGLETEMDRVREMYQNVASLLADEQLASALGAEAPASSTRELPLASLKLVELMSERIAEGGVGHLPLEQLVTTVHIASNGANALTKILSADVEEAIEAVVDWQETVDDFIPPARVVQIWHDPSTQLTTLELGHAPPNPAGPIRLPALQQYISSRVDQGGFQTMTNPWKCCSTGDFSCEPDKCGPTNFPNACTELFTATCGIGCALTTRFDLNMGQVYL